MGKKIAIATGSDTIYEYLRKKEYDVIPDISYQEGVLELVKKEFLDILIVYSELSGEFDKYIFIDKLKQVDSKAKVIIILNKEDENYKKFLWSKGIFDIFIDSESSFDELEKCINDIAYKEREANLRDKNILKVFSYKERKKCVKNDLTVKFQRQQIITFTGVGSVGKTTVASETAKILAEKTKAKVLLIDFDTVNAGVNQFMGVKRGPENPGYILPIEKNSSLNYMIEAIDKRNFNTNIFEKYILKSKTFSNLDILTGNKSLYVCKNILSSEYYSRILQIAKSLYDYIIIDASGNIFLDSMQFSVLNASYVFVVAEGNYVSMERCYRLLSELFPIWGVHSKKVQVIINKYTKESLDKTTLKELLKEYEIAGYISFSEKYEEAINSMNYKLPLECREDYYSILENLDIILNSDYLDKRSIIKQSFLQLKKNGVKLKKA